MKKTSKLLNSSKNGLPSSIQLEDAITKLSTLITSRDFGGSTADLINKNNSLEGNINILQERYTRLIRALGEEEALYNECERENIVLKSKLADEVKKHEDSKNEAERALKQHGERNKQMMTQMQAERMERNLKELELKKVKEKLNSLDEEIKGRIEESMNLKNHSTQQEQEIETIKSDIKELSDNLPTAQERLDELESEAFRLEKHLNNIKKDGQEAVLRGKQIDEAMIKLDEEIRKLEEVTTRTDRDMKAIVKKNAQNFKKLEELEKVRKELEKEIEDKNEQLNLLRTNNQNLEQKILEIESVENQFKLEREIKRELCLENELLKGELEKISAVLYDEEISFRPDMRAPNEPRSSESLHESLDRAHNLEEQNIRDQELLQNVEKDMREKKALAELQEQRIKDLESKFYDMEAIQSKEKEKKSRLLNCLEDLKIGFDEQLSKYHEICYACGIKDDNPSSGLKTKTNIEESCSEQESEKYKSPMKDSDTNMYSSSSPEGNTEEKEKRVKNSASRSLKPRNPPNRNMKLDRDFISNKKSSKKEIKPPQSYDSDIFSKVPVKLDVSGIRKGKK